MIPLVVITGTSESGLGAETAITLASGKPKQIILAARTESKVAPVIEKIKSIDSAIDVVYIKLDLLDNASVRKAAEQIKGVTDKIHGLINNAGVMGVREYITSKDGIESQFAANHVGHFLLTNLFIKEILAAGEEATVVNVASLGYQLAEANLEDPNFQVGGIRQLLLQDGHRLTRSDRRMEKLTTGGLHTGKQRQQTYYSLSH